MRNEGKIGNKVAMVNVADAFGIELAESARPIFKEAGLQIVYDKSYPLGTQDLSPIVKGERSFLNLSKGKVFCVWDAPNEKAMATWFEKMKLPSKSIPA